MTEPYKCKLKLLCYHIIMTWAHNVMTSLRYDNTTVWELASPRLQLYAPKKTIWCRNCTNLCHSACHLSILRSGATTLTVIAKLGLKYREIDPIFQQMDRLHLIARYHNTREKSKRYKMARYLARRQKLCYWKVGDTNWTKWLDRIRPKNLWKYGKLLWN